MGEGWAYMADLSPSAVVILEVVGAALVAVAISVLFSAVLAAVAVHDVVAELVVTVVLLAANGNDREAGRDELRVRLYLD